MAAETTDRPIGDLLQHLTQQMRTLVQQEINLAQAEMRQNTARLQRNLTLLVMGGIIGFSGFLALLGTGVVALAQMLPWWQAGLIGGGGALVLGLMVCIIGQVALRRTSFLPSRTLSTLLMPKGESGA
jgi:hypothetical protein